MTLLVKAFPIAAVLVIGILFSAVIWFIKKLINDTEENHKNSKKRLLELNDKIDKKTDMINENMQEGFKAQAEKIDAVKERVNIIDVKQEKLQVMATKIDDVHSTINRQADNILFLKNESIDNKKNISNIWEFIRRLELQVKSVTKVTEPRKPADLSFILDSGLFPESEKSEIVEFQRTIMATEPWNEYKYIDLLKHKLRKKEKEQRNKPVKTPKNIIIKDEPKVEKNKVEESNSEFEVEEGASYAENNKAASEDFSMKNLKDKTSWDSVSTSLLDDKEKKK